MLKRREFMRIVLGSAACAGSPARMTLAAAPGRSRFVLVILRGALDGLAAVAAYGDPAYRGQRGALALPRPEAEGGVLPLDQLFGLHPALSGLYSLYQERQLLVAHAVATPYRERSHFDGQKLLENGTGHPLGARDGWLNRALAALPGLHSGSEAAIALAQTVPLVLYGEQPVSSWAPSVLPAVDPDTLERIAAMYREDAFFADQFNSAQTTRDMAAEVTTAGSSGHRRGPGQFSVLIEAAGKFLGEADGPRIAVLESSGWDTHANQGSSNGPLANRLAGLDRGIGLLKQGLGPAWQDTVVVIASEFGRTVAVNGSNGTDHGTAGVVFIAGGAVTGGRVLADWPGLATSQLHEGRDLRPTLDMRSLFKTVLHDHLRIPAQTLENDIFPDSRTALLLQDLI